MEFIILYTSTMAVTIMIGLFFLITTYKRIFNNIDNPLYLIVALGLLLLSNPFIGVTILCVFPICYNNYEQYIIHQIEYQHNIEQNEENDEVDDDEDEDDEKDEEEDEEDEEDEDDENADEEYEEDEKEDYNTIDPDDILPENINIPSDSEEPQQHSNPVVEHLDESIDNEFRRSIEDDRDLKRRRIEYEIKESEDNVLETEYISDFLQSCGAKSNAPAPAPAPTPVPITMIERPSNPILEQSNSPSPELPELPDLPVFFNSGPSTELPTLNFQTLSELKSLPASPIEEKNVQMEEKKENEIKENHTHIVSTVSRIGCGVSCALCILKICL